MNKFSRSLFAVLALCVLCVDFVSAYTIAEFGSDIMNTILPAIGILFVMIAFPIGVGFAWKYTPGPGKIGMLVAIVLIEIAAPMGLPWLGDDYRDLWSKLLGKI